jgi:hypothetical protein
MNDMTARIIRSGEFIYAIWIAPKNKLWFTSIGSLAFCVSADLYDAVLCQAIPDVSHGMEGSGCDEDDAAGAELVGFSVVLEDDSALHEHNHLAMLNLVQRIRRCACGLLGLVHRDDLAGGKSAAQHIAAFAAVRHFSRRHLVKGKYFCLREHI